MPRVQVLHDQYSKRGLVVLAISYEAPEKLKPFLKQNGYTMIVGSDPQKDVIGAYGVRRWPTAFVIDKEGKIAFIGSSSGAEPAIEKALGLESEPGILLGLWLESLNTTDSKSQRAALDRLLEKSPSRFDLKSWATSRGGIAASDAADPMAADSACKDLDRMATLAKVRQPAERTVILDRLASSAPTDFDLYSWTVHEHGKRHPIVVGEMKGLLDEARFADAVLALVERNPSKAVVSLATKSAALAKWAKSNVAEMETTARKALMIREWLFAGRQPENNDEFWKELSMISMTTSADKKISGVGFKYGQVCREDVDRFIWQRLSSSQILRSLAGGEKPELGQLGNEVGKERERVLAELEQKY